MTKRLLTALENDLEVYIGHAGYCTLRMLNDEHNEDIMFNAGCKLAYRQAALRALKSLILAESKYKDHWKGLNHDDLIDAMIEYRIQELKNEGTKNSKIFT